MKIIGDVHGKAADYLKIIEKSEYSVQVGDFGLRWDVLIKNNVDPARHKIIGGNHDNYSSAPSYPHYLGDFGSCNLGGVNFFFIRGERSVDAHLRTEGKDWWREEELDIPAGYHAIEAYENYRPEIVISHGCPLSVVPFFITNQMKTQPSRTAQLLDAMLGINRPKMWIFGHHHNTESFTDNGTLFRCLNELETMEI
jgi:predicted phosphodiesterase